MSRELSTPAPTPSPNERAIAFLRDLTLSGFWGNVTFRIQHGEVIHVTREESIPAEKLNAAPNHRRENDTQRNTR